MQIMDPLIGLYVTLEKDGYIKRTLSTESGEQELPITTIKDEIIEFSELKFGPYSTFITVIQELANQIETEGKKEPTEYDLERFQKLTLLIDGIIKELKENSELLSFLTATGIANIIPLFDNSIECIEITKFMIPEYLLLIADFNLFVNDTFYNIYTGNSIDKDGEHYFLSQMIFEQELTFCGELTSRYFFRDASKYYAFLLMQFLSTKPKITRCECCGKYFVPKTKKSY